MITNHLKIVINLQNVVSNICRTTQNVQLNIHIHSCNYYIIRIYKDSDHSNYIAQLFFPSVLSLSSSLICC